MKENIKENHRADESILLFIRVVCCTVILLLACFFETNFFICLAVYLFLLVQMRKTLKEGFEALGRFKPDVSSLLFVSTLFSLLAGLATLDNKNGFAFCAVSLALFSAGETVRQGYKKEKYYSFADKASAFLIAFSMAAALIATVINLFLKIPAATAFKRALLSVAYTCPAAVIAAAPLGALIFDKLLKDKGVTVGKTDAIEKIGRADEIIIDEKGIFKSKEYSLYDIYSTDGDKTGLLSVAQAIESHFSHPFSYAVISASLKVGVPCLTAEACAEICGKGVCGIVNGDKYFLGNKKLMRDKKTEVPSAISAIEFKDKTPLFVSKNGEFAGFLLLYNKIAEGAVEALKLLGQSGYRRLLLTDGACEEFKEHIDVFLLPREKVLQELKKGAKIKAITVTEKPISKAEVVMLSANGGFGGADLYVESLASAAASAAYGKIIYRLLKKAVCISCMISVTFSALLALGAVYDPLLLLVLTALPLVLFIGALNYKLPQFSSSEDDIMFGKINYTMTIQGMSCTHCSAHVKAVLEALKGVSAEVSLEEKTARIKCPASTTAEALEKAVTDAGFTVISTERV